MLSADADLPVSPVKEDGLQEPFADAPAKGAGIAEDRPPDRARYPGQVFEAGQPMGGGEFNKIGQPCPGQGFDQSIIPGQGQAAGGILDDQPPVAGVIKKNISAAAYDEIYPAMPPRQTDGCFKLFREIRPRRRSQPGRRCGSWTSRSAGHPGAEVCPGPFQRVREIRSFPPAAILADIRRLGKIDTDSVVCSLGIKFAL